MAAAPLRLAASRPRLLRPLRMLTVSIVQVRQQSDAMSVHFPEIVLEIVTAALTAVDILLLLALTSTDTNDDAS